MAIKPVPATANPMSAPFFTVSGRSMRTMSSIGISLLPPRTRQPERTDRKLPERGPRRSFRGRPPRTPSGLSARLPEPAGAVAGAADVKRGTPSE